VSDPEAPRRRWRAELAERELSGLAAALAQAAPDSYVIHLRGELGAGKTTFARAFVRALLPGTRVKSPSFALVEPYTMPRGALYHVDLYRISDPAELEALGVRELAAPGTGLLVEWPERARGALPAPDLDLLLEHAGERRALTLSADSAAGVEWLRRVAENGSESLFEHPHRKAP
jgi:tRNA threonylcarbamoyladenosine biosynthesis protein TsaE